MLPHFTRYVALGDSMSIDLYPALDAGEIDVAVALERRTDAGAIAPLGAASLLYQNDDARYPDEQSNDLISRYPGIALQNLAADGATIVVGALDSYEARCRTCHEIAEPATATG